MAKKEMKKLRQESKVAKSPFILALTAGILFILLGILLFLVFYPIASLMTNNPELFMDTLSQEFQLTAEQIAQSAFYIKMVGIFLLVSLSLVGVTSIISAVLMKKEKTIRKGAITALVLGITIGVLSIAAIFYSLNVLFIAILLVDVPIIVAGALGLSFKKKK